MTPSRMPANVNGEEEPFKTLEMVAWRAPRGVFFAEARGLIAIPDAPLWPYAPPRGRPLLGDALVGPRTASSSIEASMILFRMGRTDSKRSFLTLADNSATSVSA